MPYDSEQPSIPHTREVEGVDRKETQRKPTRVWMDGSFDMLHTGHLFAMLKARALGDCLVVGAQSDVDVKLHKGPPVYPEDERFRLLKALRFVDEFVGAASYGTSVETLDKHGCDFGVHGDDITLIASETDVVKQLVKINRAKLVRRGIGTSTTNQIQQILKKTKIYDTNDRSAGDKRSKDNGVSEHWCHERQDITGSQMRAFLHARSPQPGDKIVYVDGAFDLFNVGHLSFLERAAQEGTYLLVGIHSDSTVASRKGLVFPISSLLDRALVISSLKCVSDVVFGGPALVTQEFLDHFKIDVVVRGKCSEAKHLGAKDPYAVPKKNGIFKVIDSNSEITSETIINRVVSRRAEYVARNKAKLEKEEKAEQKMSST